MILRPSFSWLALTFAVIQTGQVSTTAAGPEAHGLAEIATPAECGLEDPSIAAAAPAVPSKPGEISRRAGSAEPAGPVVRAEGKSLGTAARGALTGKTVYLSPGHGFTYLPGANGWRTQRGNTHALVEDLISVETASTYLVRYLRAMGATVVPVRELDFRAESVIVDDADPSFSIRATEQVREEGTGFGHQLGLITGNENPFDSGAHKYFDTTGKADATEVTWTLDVEVSGDYNLYIGYVADPSRAADAHYIVRHPGGETHLRVDQRRRGGTWVFLGRFHFEAGTDPARGSVSLRTDSETPGATLSADVVRIGGGLSPFDRGGGESGRPMFEHSARYYTQWAGAPPSVFDYTDTDRSNDVGSRPRFAAWDHEEGEDAVYVAWHTNAPDPGLGTSSYAYSTQASGSVADFAGVPGSLELMDAIHTQLVGDIRRDWDAEWPDRGQRTAFFGEVNPNHNPEMPATLIEVAFHSTEADADSLRDPRFRRLAARAIARGVATYFAKRDGLEVVLPPETPTSLTAINRVGGVHLEWQPVEGAESYVVYTSPNGRSFAPGIETTTPSITLDVDELEYARVAAVNSAGESLPSALIGARRAVRRDAKVLIVGGFDRLDGDGLLRDDLSDFGIATVERGFIDRINDGSHLARYGNAVAAYGAAFDAVSTEALAQNAVSLSGYELIIWFAGESSVEDEPLSAAARLLLSDYLDDGGQLFLSGSELAWTLDNIQADAHSSYFRNTFGVGFVADDADTYELTDARGPFAGLSGLRFDDQGEGGYDANFPDVVSALAGERVLSYVGVEDGAAAVFAESLGVMFFGFPFETLLGSEARDDVMERILTAFDIEPEPEPDGLVPGQGGGCGCQSGSGGGPVPTLALLLVVLALSRARWPKTKS